MNDVLNGLGTNHKTDVLEIRAQIIRLVQKMFIVPVGLGTDPCKEHLAVNPGCNNCHSFPGCSLVLTILDWLARETTEYSRGHFEAFTQGLFDGYSLGTTGVPQTKPGEVGE